MTNTFTNKNPGYRPMHVIHPVFLPFTFLIGRDKLKLGKGVTGSTTITGMTRIRLHYSLSSSAELIAKNAHFRDPTSHFLCFSTGFSFKQF